MKELSVYQRNGYYSRTDYLRCMAEDYCVPFDVVCGLANTLGANEDFDGLVDALEDYEPHMRVAVSACLLGENCKYSGGSNRCPRLIEELSSHPELEVVPVCPEVAGGLPTPRPPAEIVEGEVVNDQGVSVNAEYRAGVAAEMGRLRPFIEDGSLVAAVLQSRSPSCGVHEVYDGTFSGTLIPGRGLFAQALADAGVRLVDASEV